MNYYCKSFSLPRLGGYRLPNVFHNLRELLSYHHTCICTKDLAYLHADVEFVRIGTVTDSFACNKYAVLQIGVLFTSSPKGRYPHCNTESSSKSFFMDLVRLTGIGGSVGDCKTFGCVCPNYLCEFWRCELNACSVHLEWCVAVIWYNEPSKIGTCNSVQGIFGQVVGSVKEVCCKARLELFNSRACVSFTIFTR